MNPGQNLLNNLITQNVEVSLWGFAVNLALGGALAFILGIVYQRYGKTLSNRRMFARNFVLIAMTTCVVITVVKSSLALSLGLVGALSIVRFRAAIKEPEELSYLFLAIAIGLGLGADQRAITLVAFALIVGIVWLHGLHSKTYEENHNLFLTVSSHNPQKVELKQVIQVLRGNCSEVELRRFDDTKEELEASFQVNFKGFNQLEATRLALQELGRDVKITFLDNRGII